MDRKIEFRGKTKNNGQWVFGSLFTDGKIFEILVLKDGGSFDRYRVEPGSVGQYVGEIGNNKCEVWEDDIVEVFSNVHGQKVGPAFNAGIKYNTHTGTWQIKYLSAGGGFCTAEIGFSYFLRVIGNYYDNSQLLLK